MLVHAAISSGIRNDLGSGSRVDICVLHGDGQVGTEGGREGGREGGKDGRKPKHSYTEQRRTLSFLSLTFPLIYVHTGGVQAPCPA